MMRSRQAAMLTATIFTLGVLLAGSARADDSKRDPWLSSRVRIPWTDPSGGHFAIGYENGSWGGVWTQGLRFWIPFERWGIAVKGIALQDYENDRYDLGGRLEFVGMSPVFLNFVRLYGGGGVQAFAPIKGAKDDRVAVGGGGQFGFEFFLGRAISWIIEVGGNSGSRDEFGAGATIMAGMHLYPFSF